MEGHYGVIIMRERAQRIGGEIKVESTKVSEHAYNYSSLNRDELENLAWLKN